MKLVFLHALIIFAVSGCYTLQHRLKDTFVKPGGIFVPVFDNLTDEIGAERVFTDSLIRELLVHQELIAATRENTSYELLGTLLNVDTTNTASTEAGFKGLQGYRRMPTEQGIRVRLLLKLKDVANNKIVWEKTYEGFRRVNTLISRTNDYQMPSSVGPINQSIAESTYATVARDIMRDVYDDMLESM